MIYGSMIVKKRRDVSAGQQRLLARRNKCMNWARRAVRAYLDEAQSRNMQGYVDSGHYPYRDPHIVACPGSPNRLKFNVFAPLTR